MKTSGLSLSIRSFAARGLRRVARGIEGIGRPGTPNLLGDRDMEWSWVTAHLGRYLTPDSQVLDFGAGGGFTAYAAASLGARVLAIDLMPREFDLVYPVMEFQQTDVLNLEPERLSFDVVINCSTIEHVGLGGRYGAVEGRDDDLVVMAHLGRLLKPEGHMLLTLPVGQDAVFRPFHRVYGEDRLPRLLDGYQVLEETYLRRSAHNSWAPCSKGEALSEPGSDRYYALGMAVLTPV